MADTRARRQVMSEFGTARWAVQGPEVEFPGNPATARVSPAADERYAPHARPRHAEGQ
jgi:hypothetical protein